MCRGCIYAGRCAYQVTQKTSERATNNNNENKGGGRKGYVFSKRLLMQRVANSPCAPVL